MARFDLSDCQRRSKTLPKGVVKVGHFCPFENREGLEIHTVELYLKVRRAHFQGGLSGRATARDFGLSRDSVAKMLAYSEPPGYCRTAAIKRPKLDAFTDQIDIWLAEDRIRPRKQRHTAKRILTCP